MDLLATVRKEGSRGGRADFKWSDVQASSHRENYLGHSLMAPVGRWQKGRDLNWYAKGDKDANDNPDEDPATKAARERKEEIQRIKQAEEDALARALGLSVPPRNNPNMKELGGQREVGRVLQEAAGDRDAAPSRGVGYGRPAGIDNPKMDSPSTERIAGTSTPNDHELQHALREYKRRHGAGAGVEAEVTTGNIDAREGAMATGSGNRTETEKNTMSSDPGDGVPFQTRGGIESARDPRGIEGRRNMSTTTDTDTDLPTVKDEKVATPMMTEDDVTGIERK